MTSPRWQQLLPGLRAYVHAAWLAGEPTTINGAAKALGELRERPGGNGGSASAPVFTIFDSLEAHGVITRDELLSSDKTRVIACWNWAGLPVEQQSLRSAVEPFLAAPVIEVEQDGGVSPVSTTLPDGRVRALAPVVKTTRYLVISAVRAFLAARFGSVAAANGRKSDHSALLAACERIPVRDLPGLPDEIRAAKPGDTGEKYHTALVRLLKYAAEHDLVALAVVPPQHAHPWAAWSAAREVTPAQRVSLYRLYDAVRSLRGNGVSTDPDGVSIADANAVLQRIASARGRGQGKRAARDLESLLVSLGLRGHGPYRRLATESSLVRSGARAVAPRWMLGTGPGSSDDEAQSWESTAALLDAHGFPPVFGEFYRWYARFSMLPLDVLRAEWGNTFTRSKLRYLDASTSRQRHMALRTWLGLAVHVLGIPAPVCTPQVVFGARFDEVLKAYRAAWARRVEEQATLRRLGLPVPGQVVSHDSPTLGRNIVNAGLIAEALALWAEWGASQGLSVAAPQEIAAWRAAYASANADVEQQDKDGRKMTFRRARRTQKDIAQIMDDVSSLALVDRSNRRVMELIRRAPSETATAAKVQRALIGAIVAMGSPRIGELGLIEYGRHYREQHGQAMGRVLTRFFALDASDRKAGSDHQIPLPEEVVPRALFHWHRDHGRALLMAPWVVAGHEPHDAVFCSPEHGGPFGGLPNYGEPDLIRRAEGIDRCETNASGALSKQYESWRSGELRDHPNFRLIEGGRGHHTAHGARNQTTRLVTNLDMGDRLPFLLGHMSKNRSEEMYGTSLAATNAETIRRILKAAPWFAGPSPDADAPSTIDGMRGRSRAARAQLERDAALGRAMREALFPRLDGMAPREIQRAVEDLHDHYGG